MWLLPETGGALWIYSITHLHGPVLKALPELRCLMRESQSHLGWVWQIEKPISCRVRSQADLRWNPEKHLLAL